MNINYIFHVPNLVKFLLRISNWKKVVETYVLVSMKFLIFFYVLTFSNSNICNVMNLQYLQYYINRGTCNTYFLIVFMQITHIAHQ